MFGIWPRPPFFVVAILPVVFVVSSTPSFFEYWVSSLFTDMHIIKSKAANDLGNGGPPENYAPKILKCWKEKSQNQSCWYFRTPPHANHESLFSAHFLSCTSEYLGHSRRFPRNDSPRGDHGYTLEYLLSREASSTGWSPSPPSSTCTMHHMISHRKSVEAVRIKERKIRDNTNDKFMKIIKNNNNVYKSKDIFFNSGPPAQTLCWAELVPWRG